MKKPYPKLFAALPKNFKHRSALYAIIFLMAACPFKLFAQAPAIGYSSPQAYAEAVAIATLSPTNSGGAVAATGYNVPINLGAGLSHPLGIESFKQPTGVAVDAAGNVYVADELNNAVEKVPAGSDTVIVIDASITEPTSVAVDAAGNVYAVSAVDNLVVKIPVGGGSPVTIGSGFNQPFGVAVDAAGYVYVGDGGNNAV